MKGPFFLEKRISYDLLFDSNFDDVDRAVNAIKLKYDVEIKKKVEGFDSYWMMLVINQKYNVCVRHHDPVGLVVYARDEPSNNIVTEIANYLSKEVFDEREDISNSNSI